MDAGWAWLGARSYLSVPTAITYLPLSSHITWRVKQEAMTDTISLWSDIVGAYINTTDAICECAETG